jgi:hypothetical protein
VTAASRGAGDKGGGGHREWRRAARVSRGRRLAVGPWWADSAS